MDRNKPSKGQTFIRNNRSPRVLFEICMVDTQKTKAKKTHSKKSNKNCKSPTAQVLCMPAFICLPIEHCFTVVTHCALLFQSLFNFSHDELCPPTDKYYIDFPLGTKSYTDSSSSSLSLSLSLYVSYFFPSLMCMRVLIETLTLCACQVSSEASDDDKSLTVLI